MKKKLFLFSATFVLTLCCFFGITAYAQTSIDDANVVLKSGSTVSNSCYYSGTKREMNVDVYVTIDNLAVKLKKDVDYTQTFYNNINVGTATVNIDGIGNYSGHISKNFEILKKSLYGSGVVINAPNTNYVYNKKSYTPIYSVTCYGKKLVLNKDYTVKYSNNLKAGYGTATITGINNFASYKKYNFKISPQQVTSIYMDKKSYDYAQIKFSSQSEAGVTGYKVYVYDSKSKTYKYRMTTSTNVAKLSSLSAGYSYALKVRSYKKVGDNYVYGAYSNVYKFSTKPKTVTLQYVTKNASKKTVTVHWNKVTSSGYQIEYTTDKNFKKGVKILTIADPSCYGKTIGVPNGNSTYYVKVRAYKKIDNKTTYGDWSSLLSTYYGHLYEFYSSPYVNNPSRTTNLILACKAINGTIVQPGATFSFNATVGERTKQKGYKEAHIFAGSGTVMGLGGGVCQVASTMYNAALYCNFQIVERHQHSQRVSYVPLGRDAAIYWKSQDFKFKNTSKYPVKINTYCSNGRVYCKIYNCVNSSPKKVSLKVSQSGNKFTLKRYADGICNYTAYSKY